MLLQVLTESDISLKCLVKQINFHCVNGCVTTGTELFSAYSIPIPDDVLLSGEQAYFKYLAGNFPQFYIEAGKSALLPNPEQVLLHMQELGWDKRFDFFEGGSKLSITTTVTYRDVYKPLHAKARRVKTF